MVEEEAIVGDMRMVFSLREGNIVMVESKVAKRMRHADGIYVRDVPVADDARLIAIMQDGDAVMVNPETVLHAGDTVVAAVKSGHEEEFRSVMRHL